jgi:class 3 adenylate cyclase
MNPTGPQGAYASPEQDAPLPGAVTAAAGQALRPPIDPAPGSLEGSSADTPRRRVLGTVLFLNLVASPKHPADQQRALRERSRELVGKALKGVAESSRIVMAAGDGVAICFLGDPEEALQSALLLRGLMRQKYGQMLRVRIGLHLGPVRLVHDASQRVSVVGDGINVAQRIMDFAQPNQIVVSRAYHDVISRIMDNAAVMFSAMGPHLDNHLRSHDIYAVLDRPSPPAHAAQAHNTEFENTASFAALATLTPAAVADIEAELAESIGPLAKVLVSKAVTRTVSAQGLRDLLAVSIPDAAMRQLFIQPKNHETRPPPPPAGQADGAGLPLPPLQR